MTLLNENRRDQYTLSGVGPYNYNFKILEEAHLAVYIDDVLQVSGYTVTGVGADAGGTVTFTSDPGAGTLTLLRDMPLVQETDFITGDKFPANSVETALDYARMVDLQLLEQIERALSGAPSTGGVVNFQLPDPTGNAGKFLVANATGDGFEFTDDEEGTPVLTTKGDLLTRDNIREIRLPVGTDDQVLIADSSAASGLRWGSTFGSSLRSRQIFSGNGTWTRPAGVRFVIVEVQGGGGAGGGAETTGAGQYSLGTGGAAGGYVRALLDVTAIGTSTITVGAGGTGSTGADGGAGSDSIWSDGTNTLTGGGGGGGVKLAAAAAIASVGSGSGSATGGDLNVPGGNPWACFADGGVQAGFSGGGGDSYFGFGGAGRAGTGGDGNSGGAAGAAGGGGINAENQGVTRKGGNGTAGRVIVWEFL